MVRFIIVYTTNNKKACDDSRLLFFEQGTPIRLTNLGFEIASQEEVLDLFPIEHFLKKVWWSHINEVK